MYKRLARVLVDKIGTITVHGRGIHMNTINNPSTVRDLPGQVMLANILFLHHETLTVATVLLTPLRITAVIVTVLRYLRTLTAVDPVDDRRFYLLRFLN